MFILSWTICCGKCANKSFTDLSDLYSYALDNNIHGDVSHMSEPYQGISYLTFMFNT